MSRVPRSQEHLKTGFQTEAVSAAKFRAYAQAAESEGLAKLAERLRSLAEQKDQLAIQQLEAAGQVRAVDRSLADALAEERFENDVLYPKMIRDLGSDDAADIFRQIVEAQQSHAAELADLRQLLQGASGDIA